jgi:excisionase family DNA binding protein
MMAERTTDRTVSGHVSGAPDTWPLTAREAALTLGVSERTIRRAIARGELAATKRAGVYRIAPDAIARFRRERRDPTVSPPPTRREALRLVLFPERETGDTRDSVRPLTSLIEREGEVAEVRALLLRPDVPLLTLTGPGGIGKTRLALRVLADLRAEAAFTDGSWFVELAPIADPDSVAATVARAVGVRETAGRLPLDGLRAHLSGEETLLVLDNFEHLLPAAPFVVDLLGTCPRLTVLVTSRTVMRVTGERDYPVPPLSLPKPNRQPPLDEVASAGSVRLFIERAQAVKPDFSLSEANAGAVAAICRRLDGVPLAIELAAARSNTLPPPALLDRLERSLPLLTGGPRDAPARLRSMRDAIAWSYDLLTTEDQALFRRLGVFVGGFSLEAAEAVFESGATLDGVASLVDKSLLHVEADSDGESRYVMLETVREYGLEQLQASGEAGPIRDAHAAYFLALAERAEPASKGPDQRIWMARLDTEQANLDAALDWFDDRRDIEQALRLAGALHAHWYERGHLTEGRRRLDDLLAVATDEVSADVRAEAFLGAGHFAQKMGDQENARRCYEACLALAREAKDRRRMAHVLLSLGHQAHQRNDSRRAEDCLSEALMLSRQFGDHWHEAWALADLGELASGLGDQTRAIACLQEAVALFDLLGDHSYRAWSLRGLASAVCRGGDPEQAIPLAEEALAVLRELENKVQCASTLRILGEAVQEQGDTVRAAAIYQEAFLLLNDLGHRWIQIGCLLGVAKLAGALGQAARAARLLAAQEPLRAAFGFALLPVEQPGYTRAVDAARGDLGDAGFAAAWQEGRSLSIGLAIAEAFAVVADPVPTIAPASRHGLTRREGEVLGLLVEGRTDREIADALSIGRRTVETHVAAILNKLGLDSRTAVAAYAVRHGLA